MVEKARAISLALLFGIYPVIFLYSQNANILNLGVIWLPLLLSLGLAALTVAGLLLFRLNAWKAGNTAMVVLMMFFIFGAVNTAVLAQDLVPVRLRFLMPAYVLLTVGLGLLISRVPSGVSRSLNQIAWVMACGLIVYNIAVAVPVEMEKAAYAREQVAAAQIFEPAANIPAVRPDIYFIIMDEFAGPRAMREYWHNNDIDAYITSLRAQGFMVAERSKAPNADTLQEIASRLDLHNYSVKDIAALFDVIRDNRVMRTLKAYGYTTVVFDNVKEGYTNKSSILADYELTYSESSDSTQATGMKDFMRMLLDTTLLKPVSNRLTGFSLNQSRHQKAIAYTLDRAANLADIPSPKFVYVHLMIPHVPFVFDAYGNRLDLLDPLDWSYYLGQHAYTILAVNQLVEHLLQNADPANMPVIVIQSDHGVRNLGKELENYDDSYKYDIFNALYLPGYDISQLPDDLNPHLTFEIILNHYFNAGVTYEP